MRSAAPVTPLLPEPEHPHFLGRSWASGSPAMDGHVRKQASGLAL